MESKLYIRIATTLESIRRGKPNGFDCNDSLDKIKEFEGYLPSGSGVDSGCTIETDKLKYNQFVIHTDYHHMDTHGMYCGWTSFDVIVNADLVLGFDLKFKNKKYDSNECKRLFNEFISDYLYELFYDNLNTYIGY